VKDHLGHVDILQGHAALELRAGEAYLVRALQRAHVLWSKGGDWCCGVHRTDALAFIELSPLRSRTRGRNFRASF